MSPVYLLCARLISNKPPGFVNHNAQQMLRHRFDSAAECSVRLGLLRFVHNCLAYPSLALGRTG